MFVAKRTKVLWAQSVGAEGIRFNHGGVREWVRRGLRVGGHEHARSGTCLSVVGSLDQVGGPAELTWKE